MTQNYVLASSPFWLYTPHQSQPPVYLPPPLPQPPSLLSFFSTTVPISLCLHNTCTMHSFPSFLLTVTTVTIATTTVSDQVHVTVFSFNSFSVIINLSVSLVQGNHAHTHTHYLNVTCDRIWAWCCVKNGATTSVLLFGFHWGKACTVVTTHTHGSPVVEPRRATVAFTVSAHSAATSSASSVGMRKWRCVETCNRYSKGREDKKRVRLCHKIKAKRRKSAK